jgi:hypothetical protein
VQFIRTLVYAATTGMGKKTAEEIAAGLRPKFPVFTKEELLTDMEYGGTPLSRAVINVNVAFQELEKLRRAREALRARLRAARYGGQASSFLPLPELQRHAALDAARHTGDGRAVGGEVARKVP